MSDFNERLQKWRSQGSLQYLAHELGRTTKQVTRYWDDGLIPGRYKTRKGHRRIRYTDETVDLVASDVAYLKATNIAVRYHLQHAVIKHEGAVIPVKGCTKIKHLYRRARKAGLSDKDARHVAASVETEQPDIDLEWEYLLMQLGISSKELADSKRRSPSLDLEFLREATDPKDFRARARVTWRRLNRLNQNKPGWEQDRDALRRLLLQPDRKSFFLAWRKADELHSRLIEDGEAIFDRVAAGVKMDPQLVKLHIAALSFRHSQRALSATALAKAFGIGRSALYRAFGTEKIQSVLSAFKNDARAIYETQNEMPAKGKKTNRIGEAGGASRSSN